MKYLLKGINEINETLKAIDDIDRYYFGKVDDSTTRQFKDNQFGYYEVEVGPYDDEYTFHPYNDQERMKTIYNTLKKKKKRKKGVYEQRIKHKIKLESKQIDYKK